MRKVLLIEDNQEELIFAKEELVKAGIDEFKIVETLSEALDSMHLYDLVISDLFFPLGKKNGKEYIQKFLPIFEAYREERFPPISQHSPIYRAIIRCATTFKMEPKEYIDLFMANDPKMKKIAIDAINGFKDSERYAKFLITEQKVKEGTYLPLGIISTEQAGALGISSVIVTSTYHHDDSFEAVSSLIKVPYTDKMINGRKNWRGGIELLLG